MKILCFTTDLIPLPGMPTSGTALRTWGLIQGLKAHGHEVIISVPKNALEGMKKNTNINSLDKILQNQLKDLQKTAFDSSNQHKLCKEINPECILCGHWPAVTFNSKPSQLLILDLAGPHLLERHYQETPNHNAAVLGKLNSISKADYFIVSGEKQRLYFLSFLLRANIPDAEKRIFKITMPLNPQLPQRPSINTECYPHFVFAGVFLPWQNPSLSLKTTANKITQKNKGKLSLIGGEHPNYPIKAGIYKELFAELKSNDFVNHLPLLAYEDFIRNLLDKDIAIDLMQWNLERELALTIRSTTYLWAGVPIIYNNFADLGILINNYNAGWTIPSDDQAALEKVLEEIYSDPNTTREKSLNAQKLATDIFSWDKAVSPLLSILGSKEQAKRKEIDILLDFPKFADYPITQHQEVEQYFLSRTAGLYKVECRIANKENCNSDLIASVYQIENSNNYTAELSKLPKKLIEKKRISKDQIRANEWLSLELTPQKDSAGNTFLLKLESESTNSDCSPWTINDQPFPLLGLYYQNKLIKHSLLCLRTTCSN